MIPGSSILGMAFTVGRSTRNEPRESVGRLRATDSLRPAVGTGAVLALSGVASLLDAYCERRALRAAEEGLLEMRVPQ